MIGKSLLAAAAIATTLTAALPAPQAKADVDVDIGIGFGGYYPDYPAPRDYGYGEGRYGNGYGEGRYGNGYGEWHHQRRRLSCYRGANIVDDAGFYRVNPVDCSAPSYAYTAWKRGQKFVVRLNSYGTITSIRKIF